MDDFATFGRSSFNLVLMAFGQYDSGTLIHQGEGWAFQNMGLADSNREVALVIKYFILWSIYLVVAVIAFNIVLAVVLEGYEMAKERRNS